jgi:hypothetical protein
VGWLAARSVFAEFDHLIADPSGIAVLGKAPGLYLFRYVFLYWIKIMMMMVII